MATIKSYTDINQSKKLVEILPLESADMAYWKNSYRPNDYAIMARHTKELQEGFEAKGMEYIPCWSLSALLSVLPEINGVSLKIERVKAEDGYDGYYYHIEYENKILILYSKNPVDACVEMIIKLHEQKII